MIPRRIPSRIHTRLRWAIAGAAMFAWVRMALSQQPASPRAVSNETVLGAASGDGRTGMSVLTGVDRVVSSGRRISVSRDAPRGAGMREFLVAGLWDMRSHHQLTGVEALDLLVAKGVVGARGPGSGADFIYPLRDRIHHGELPGPEIAAAGPILGDAPQEWPLGGRATGPEEAREALRGLKRRGADLMPREAFFAIAQETKKHGMTFAGRVPISATVEEAGDSGAKSILRPANERIWGDCSAGNDPVRNAAARRALFQKLAAREARQTPTMEFFGTAPDVLSGKPIHHAECASDSLPAFPGQNLKWRQLDERTLTRFRIADAASLTAIGGLSPNKFLAGCVGLVPGFCLHNKVEWLTKAGRPPQEALKAATIHSARFPGQERSQGAMEAGKRAGLALLDADPLKDVTDVRRSAAAAVRGRLPENPEMDRIQPAHRRPDLH